ncbi:hypothetical protein Plec18167_009629 [Paecilomyces lecythidis]|uniref:Carboxy-cis,cis-muconate cyclase n=1 Tax=Paecilomyces lecythidis TaxID=3004212 RepID=A0ABR3WME5_9EURO
MSKLIYQLQERHENIYVASGASYDSYEIASNLTLNYQGSLNISDSCGNANFIVASTASPFAVFGAPYSLGCSGQAITVDSSGTLTSISGNITYGNSSGVHGLALDANNEFIYSGDDMGNAVWVHSFNKVTGAVTQVQHLEAPTGANPRHLAVHPKGKYVYVVFEEANQLGVYARELSSGKLTYTNTTYPLIPSGYTNSSLYWSDEVAFSFTKSDNPKYLLASARSRTTSAVGYVTAFSLGDTGAISKQLFLSPTTGSGGAANSVSPASFDEDYFAITDSGSNFVEVWKINATAKAGVTAGPVAHLDLDNGPANIVWYS